jgi:hypothetical protein
MPRPTLRCLREDLKLSPGTGERPLDEIEHPLMDKVREQFADLGTRHERILSVTDTVLFKAKIQRWRGAVWIDPTDAEPRVWLVAAGTREDGSPDDFYAVMAARAMTACDRLLPNDDDRTRYIAESAVRFERRLAAVTLAMCRKSLLDGHEHSTDIGGASLGIQVRAERGHETYVAIRITGKVPEALTAAVLDLIPGCEPDGWFPEYGMPERPSAPAEQVWSNVMDPEAAAKLLNEDM